MRPELRAIVDALLASDGAITLDALGEALGARAVYVAEIEAMVDALEAAGRPIVGPTEPQGVARLHAVLSAARALRQELGRTPTVKEIAARTTLPLDAVKHALELAKVIQR
jgi:DNA-directed RNA polymerase sigma subunit (sigma70/sigma32)